MNTNIQELVTMCDGYSKDVAAIDKKGNLLGSEPTEREREKRKNTCDESRRKWNTKRHRDIQRGARVTWCQGQGTKCQQDCGERVAMDLADHSRVSLEDESAKKTVLVSAKSLRDFDSTDLP